MVLQGVGADGAGLLGPRIERLVRGAAGGRASAAQKMLLGGACAVAVFAGAACHRALPELKPDPKIAEDQKRSKAMQTEWEEIRKMNADQARALEASVAQNPEDIQLRNKLMRFYQSRGRDVLGDAAATSGFYAQQLWCIEHHPENACSSITPPLFDDASYRKGAALWESALKRGILRHKPASTPPPMCNAPIRNGLPRFSRRGTPMRSRAPVSSPVSIPMP